MTLNNPRHWWTGVAIFLLAVASSPATVFSAPAPSSPSGLLVADRLATFTQLDLYANIETIGVVVGGSNLPATAELLFHQSGDTTWHSGHRLMRIGDGRLVGSLFGLAPATIYNIKVVDGASEISGSIATQPEELQFTPSAIVHVNASAPAGGDGSMAAPFQTIQAGVNHAGPGAQVLVADGVYHEAVTFPASGTADNWIQVKAQGSSAILDGSLNRTGKIWTPVAGVNHVYFTKIQAAIAYLARDQKRFYAYDNRTGLNQGLGHNGVPMKEGWFFEASTLKLFVRSLDDPSGHTWQIPILNYAFDANGRDWLWIEGFEMRFYGTSTSGCGVCTTNASHLVIRKNKIHNLQLGIFFNWNGTDSQGNDTRIEFNEIYDPPVNEWPWAAVKGSSMEGTAIVVRGHIGAIVRGNELHNFFNGIYTGSSGALENSALAFDADIYNNHIHHVSDDALEPEGACINQRFRNNIVDTVFVGMSLAPITQGPTWVLRSSFTNYSGRAFKWDGNSDGIVLIYHNTAWSNAAGINAMDMISPIHNAVLRNNIFQSNGLGVNEVATGSTGLDWNDDNWYITRAVPHFKWENVSYDALAGLCAATGLECDGYETSPGFVNPAGGDFTLLSTSPNVNRGVVIAGVNDDFSGSAPDVGAFEYISALESNTDVYIGGSRMDSYTIPAHSAIRPSYAGLDSGPVVVTNTTGTAIVASIRDLWSDSTHATSSIQVMGLPASLLSTSYYFPAYNNVSLDDQLRFGNVGTQPTWVTVTIGGVVQGSYWLAPSTSMRLNYTGVDSGPVVVSSSGGVPIIASIRDSWQTGGEWTSYSQLMGLPASQLSSSYYFPAYNNVSLDDQIRFGNVGSKGTTVTVKIAGVVKGTYYLLPSQSQRVSYAGVDSGPVVVSSSGSVPIIASIRDSWWDGARWTSYSQLMGLPLSQLSTAYHFPVYENVGQLDGQLRFGNVGTSPTTVTVTIGGELQGSYDLAPSGSLRVSYPNLDSGPVKIQSSGGVPIIASLRDSWWDGSVWTSYAQLMGLPNGQLSTSYYFPAYNNVSLDDQLRIGAP